MDKNLFAPPKEDELKEERADLFFEPPTKEELEEQGAPGWFLDQAKDAGTSILRDYVAPAGRFVDSFTGAPTRKAVMASMKGENPIPAFLGQFGENPENAPTGQDIARKMGASDKTASDVLPDLFNDTGEGWQLQKGGWADPSASGAAGLAIDIGADWSNLIPVSAAAKLAGKAGVEATDLAAKASAKVADVATGTKIASELLDGTKKAGKSLKSAVNAVAKPERAQGWDKITEVARQNGIDPELLSESIEFGPNSFISRTARNVREGAAGEEALKRFQQGADQIGNAVGKGVENLGGGKPLGAVDAGQVIREGFGEYSKKFFDNIDLTHGKIIKTQPGLFVDREAMGRIQSLANGIEKHAVGLIKRGDDVDVSQGRYLLRKAQQLRSTNGSYKQMHEVMTSIREKAFPKKQIIGAIPHDVDRLRDMYFTIDDALIDTTRKHVNPEFADEIVANNQAISSFYRDKSHVISEIAGRDVADEQVFNRLLGNTKKIEALKKVISPEAFQKVRGAYLNQSIKRTPDGHVLYGSSLNALRNDRDILGALFSPEEIGKIEEVLKLGDSHGPAILSHSGTGASVSFNDLPRGIATGTAKEKMLEYLKAKARKRALEAKPMTPKTRILNEAGEVDPQLLLRFLGNREGRTAQFGKGAQSIAPQYYSTDEEAKNSFIQGN